MTNQHPSTVILFVWNPKRTQNGDFGSGGLSSPDRDLTKVRAPRGLTGTWNIGRRKCVETGAIAMLVRTGTDNPGVVLSGTVLDGQARYPDESGQYVQVCWTAGINWADDPALAISSAVGAKAARRIGYCLQQSGHALEGKDAVRLLTAWMRHASYYSGREVHCPGFDRTAATFRANEGKAWRVQVLKRERSKDLRRRLLRQGARCSACGLDPIMQYGADAGRVLEVHHLEAIACGPRATLLDDVRLLCRNCHAIAHIRNPPISIAGIKKLIEP